MVVVAVLFLAGVFNSPGSSSIGTGPAVPFSAAVGVASSQGSNTTGGPWTVVAAIGIGVSIGVSQPNSEYVGSSGCTFTPVRGGSAQVTVLGTPANSTAGEVATWMFMEKNASGNVILMSTVSNDALTLDVLVTGCSSVETFAAYSPVSASADVDSTIVASSFDANGGSSFLANHAVVTETFILIGASSSTPGAWEVQYSTCPLAISVGSGTWISGYYYASSGAVLSGPTTGSGPC